MKKFMICVALGYAFVFLLFIGLPQMMEKRGRGAGAPLSPPRSQQTNAMDREAIRAETLLELQENPALRELKDIKRYETGPVETYYENGTLSSEWILDSEGRGVFKTYTQEGRPWRVIPFTHNRLEGELLTFYAEGPVFSKENYRAGEKTGADSWWYKNGKLWLEINRDSQGVTALSALYSENGTRVDLPAVRVEPSTGYFKAFDEQGREVINLQQFGGDQTLVLKSFYESGKLSAEMGLQGKNLNGRMVLYYPNGMVLLETNFNDGRLSHGVNVYLEAGALSFKEMLLTEPRGGLEWTTYYPDGKFFWELTRTMNERDSLFFQLTTHWQNESSSEATQKRELL